MPINNQRLRARLIAAVLGLATGFAAFADDTEIYLNNNTATSAVKPNIMLMVDTSRSMIDNNITNERARYAPGTTYGTADNCTSGRVFFRKDGDPMPTCTSPNWIPASAIHCKKLSDATGSSGQSGRWSGKAAQWKAGPAATPVNAWEDLVAGGTTEVECFADNNVHGHNTNNTLTVKYAQNGDPTNKWTNNGSLVVNWSQRKTYTFYSSNWMNWYRTTPATTTRTRMAVMQDAIVDMVSSIDDVNMGMMRFNTENGTYGLFDDRHFSGGIITNRVEDITTGRANLISRVLSGVDGFGGNGYAGHAGTPLSETLYEAKLYWAGETAWRGRVQGAYDASTNKFGYDPAAFVGTSSVYQSPITHQCQRNFTVVLTDGAPTWDTEANTSIQALTGNCDGPDPGDTSIGMGTSGRCFDDLAGWLNDSGTDLRPAATGIAGNQTAQTYIVAFGADVDSTTATSTFLNDVATEGGGQAYNAGDSDELQEVLTSITNQVLSTGTTFSTASVSVNAFNRTSSRNELYYAMFAPQDRLRWDGNLKKYKLTPYNDAGTVKLRISDATGAGAIDTTGLFRDTSRSYWSPGVDGNNVALGGAANKLPDQGSRVLLTYTGANPAGTFATLTELDALPAATQDSEFATNATSDPTTTDVLNFAYSNAGKRMGDPLHSSPVVVTFGGTSTTPVDTVYVATNDGFLHAVDASTGIEKWSFVPKELLLRLKDLEVNPAVSARTYGLDGDLRVIKLDRDNDGLIESADGDVVWLFFGMRRGGKYYYGLDVTANNSSPKLMWKIGPDELPRIGETWSPPTVARVNVSGATQNAQKLVLIFGGGYDAAHETNYSGVLNDTTGNRIFMVDAKSGTLLWYAGSYNGVSNPVETLGQLAKRMDTNPSIEKMDNAITGRVSVIDLDGDQYADRMYAADLGGRVWRFDIFNGNPPKTLVTGGVFAELGQGGISSPDILKARRFYSAPDVALMQVNGVAPFFNLAIGSGYRGHPLQTSTQDRFYSLRDKMPFSKLPQNDYDSLTALTEGTTGTASTLTDMTGGIRSVPVAAAGWFRNLPNSGEKALSEATQAGSTIMFTTYQPLPAATNECESSNRNRAYAINLFTGLAALDLDATNNPVNLPPVISEADISQVLDDTSGITGEVRIAAMRGLLDGDLDGDGDVDANDERLKRERDDEALCIAGRQILGRCVAFDDAVRTYWRRNADAGM
jgi:type IV pilus assembly protein PilY1